MAGPVLGAGARFGMTMAEVKAVVTGGQGRPWVEKGWKLIKNICYASQLAVHDHQKSHFYSREAVQCEVSTKK